MTRPTCDAIRKDGERCRAPALPDSVLCWSHDPRQAETAARARAEGASKGGKLRALKGRRPKLDSPRALVRFVADLAQDTLSGAVEPDVSRAVAYCVSLQIRLLEASELERRVAELEARYAASGRVAR